uniref:DUF4005 domain-containing protein n=2 Tax=Rhizophora mucronata TaxID=61149 RepID=A0A2P2IRF1_RHIMU
MGKASKWFRAVLGLKKPEHPPPFYSPSSQQKEPPSSRSKEKRRWSFVKPRREKSHATAPKEAAAVPVVQSSSEYEEDPNKHAIAVAAATAAVAEAAVAAAHAAAEVVRLTSSGRCATNPAAAYVSGSGSLRLPEDLAAIRIQSSFRGYLARRALRALKALVRLQALVRGHIERKRTAEWLHRMQALLRAQARARAGRVQISESSNSSSKSAHFRHPGPPTPEKYEHAIRNKTVKNEQSSVFKRTRSKSNGKIIGDLERVHLPFSRSEHRMDEQLCEQKGHLTRSGTLDTENSDKILEIDTGKPHFTPKRRNHLHPSYYALASDQCSHSCMASRDSTTQLTFQSPSSGGEVQSLSPLKFSHEVEEAFCTAENSPQFYTSSSRGGGSGKRSPFTPSRSDGSRSFLSGYSDYPNYMSNTESSRAKVRSLSAPKQRPQYERSTSMKRYNIYGEPRSSSAQRASALRANFASKAYPGSGRLDRLGMPLGQRY